MIGGVLTDLTLHDFRCFRALDFLPGPGRTFLVGGNAQGKTSLLEAICVLLRLQSPRTSSASEMVRMGSSGFALDGHCQGSHLAHRFADGERSVALDSKPNPKTDDYLSVSRVAWFANSDLELVRGGGTGRRRFLDFLGSQCRPGYRQALRAYEKSLRSRNALLKEMRPRREIAAFDEPLLQAGETLLEARRSLVEILAPLAREACCAISGGNDKLALRYRPGCGGGFREALAESRPEEERLRQTVVGPHRDDMVMEVNGLAASDFASEGQQRSIALALKAGQARHLEDVQGRPPILLLDDVFGELDPCRRNSLLEMLPGSAQAIITTTFIEWAGNTHNDTVFDLSSGTLTLRSPRIAP